MGKVLATQPVHIRAYYGAPGRPVRRQGCLFHPFPQHHDKIGKRNRGVRRYTLGKGLKKTPQGGHGCEVFFLRLHRFLHTQGSNKRVAPPGVGFQYRILRKTRFKRSEQLHPLPEKSKRLGSNGRGRTARRCRPAPLQFFQGLLPGGMPHDNTRFSRNKRKHHHRSPLFGRGVQQRGGNQCHKVPGFPFSNQVEYTHQDGGRRSKKEGSPFPEGAGNSEPVKNGTDHGRTFRHVRQPHRNGSRRDLLTGD
ncbi:MAG: hypothetical protein BWX80_03721 [Candidatus Hydrogenedentes bacterium ADurb.Bin101]|nr:MAG: hypothetical protein BWX80_03721 [Candidatus Hydrogenedentes bacterium ADurb.Bin101]